MARRHSLKEILEILREQIPLLRERYNVETLEVFGSYVRGDQKKDSDLDILVTFKEAPGLLTFIAIENYLSDLLSIKVDLVMKDSLKPRIGEQIQRETIPIKIEAPPDRNEFDALIKQARKQAKEAGLERKDINSAVAKASHHK
jgi:uncharacterized protein